jgi:hypothetical protein
MLDAMRGWPLRRWPAAAGATAVFTVLVSVPTDLIDTPLFGREVPAPWWAWPSVLVSAVLAGLLSASYVAYPSRNPAEPGGAGARPTSGHAGGGWAGTVLTFFAVGCPVCNKLVLVALGSAGALTWFQPVQPLLQAAALVLLLWALRARLRGELSCPTDPDREATHA